MNIIVCAKQTPDTEAKIKVKDGKVDLSEVEFIVNPYDEFAAEEALRIVEKFGGGKIYVLTLGPERADKAIKSVLALGVDEGAHLKDPAFEGFDAYSAAYAMKAAIQKMQYDLILCGKQGVDEDNAQFGIILAELLGIPHVSVITKLEIAPDKKSATAHREIDGGVEIVQTPLPAVFTCQKGLNEPRYASLKGIMAVKKKKIEVWDLNYLGLSTDKVGAKGAKIEYIKVEPPPPRQAGKKFQGDTAEITAQVVKLLREEAKII